MFYTNICQWTINIPQGSFNFSESKHDVDNELI